MKKLLALLLLAPALAFAQYTAIPAGLYWPYQTPSYPTGGTAATLDATAEKAAHCGYAYWNGRPASKTIDNSANSKISFATGAVDFNTAAGLSTIDIGFQAPNTSGPIVQPDGTWLGTVKRTLVSGTDTINATAWNEFALNTAGTSFTLSQGQLVCVVIDATAITTDSVTVATMAGSSLPGSAGGSVPITNAFVAAWQTTVTVGAGQAPMVTFTANDGTIGTLGPLPYSGLTTDTQWSNATNPDERTETFTVPVAMKADALWSAMRNADGASDFTLTLYSGCEASGTVASLSSVAVDGTQQGAAQPGVYLATIATEIVLTPGITYCVGVKATSTGTLRLNTVTIADAASRAFMPGTTSMQGASRDNSSGSFASHSTTVHYPMGVRISAILTSGSGGGVF